MKIYLFTRCNAAGQRKAQVYFFLRSALSAARRTLAERDDWEEIGNYETSATHFWRTPHCWMSIVPMTVFFRDWSLRRWIRDHGHAQNLNEDCNGKIKGTILKRGRAWFRPFGYGQKRGLEFCWEWSLWTRFWALQFDVGAGDSDDGLSLWVAFGLLSFHFTVEGILPRRFIEWGRQRALKTPYLGYEFMAWPRSIGISFFEQTIWFEIWNGDFGWDRRQPKWMSFIFSPVDFLLGKRKYASKNLLASPALVDAPMPEATYPVEVMLTEDSWKRPRWPWPMVRRRADVKCLRPIPIPGKGENSWDCGEDAIYATGCAATTVDEALAALKDSVLKTRERYGGKNWKPDIEAK